MCPHLSMTRKKGIMSNDVHRMIVDKIAAWGAPISLITHAGLGEPLLDPDLSRKIAYEKEVFKEAQVAVFTNAGSPRPAPGREPPASRPGPPVHQFERL